MDEALRIALRQPAVASDPHVLFAAASTCKDWQPALQLGSFDVKVKLQPSLGQLRTLASWLPKHAGCVSSLTVNLGEDDFDEEFRNEQRGEMLQRAEELLLQALQPSQQGQAAVPSAATAVEAADDLPALTAAAPPPPAAAVAEPAADDPPDLLAAATTITTAAPSAGALRLTSFSSNCITSAGVLQLLPAHTLTRLELQIVPKQHDGVDQANNRLEDTHAWATAIAQLSNLKHLQLMVHMSEDGAAFSDSAALEISIAEACLAGVAHVRCLTSLELSFRANDAWEEAIGSENTLHQALAPQRQLQRLQISLGHANYAGLPALAMAHLAHLSELTIGCMTAGIVLPRQLKRLFLDSCSRRDIYCLASLKQLQQLHVGYCSSSDLTSLTALSSLQTFCLEVWEDDPEDLLRLAQLPLQNLALQYYNVPSVAAATAPAWPKLPQLRELNLLTHDYLPSKQQLLSILAGLTACSGLTKLSLDGSYSALLDHGNPDALDPEQLVIAEQVAEAEDAAAGRVAVCSSMASLTQLKDLTLTYADKVPGDALALTALTGLTRLVLAGGGAGVDGLAAAALACRLRQLRHLDLSECDLGSMGCLAAVGQMTQLTELQLKGNEGVTQWGLMQLTKLQKLRRLGVDRNEKVTDAVLRQFWAAVPAVG